MMISEFIERTKYEPDMHEYHLIEMAYYDFDGDKDAFCAHWLKEYRAGRWEREKQLLNRIDWLEDRSAHEREAAKAERDELENYYKIQIEQYDLREEQLKKQLQKYQAEERIRKSANDILRKFLSCGA